MSFIFIFFLFFVHVFCCCSNYNLVVVSQSINRLFLVVDVIIVVVLMLSSSWFIILYCYFCFYFYGCCQSCCDDFHYCGFHLFSCDGLFDIADNNNGFFGLTLIITLFGVSIFCDLLHQTFWKKYNTYLKWPWICLFRFRIIDAADPEK